MTQESAAKKDTQKLQRAIVDGLEDVKGQDIQVFNTEHLSPLFERVIVASGTSNRQTRALASSVVDAVRDAGFAKPRIEGEENGEWIIVDCGPAVAHIMQPAIRQYYHLEEIWGEKPVRLRVGAPKPVAPVREAPAKAKPASPSLRRSSAVKTAARADAAAKKAPAKTKAATGAKSAGPAPRQGAAKPSGARAAPPRPTSAKAAPAKAPGQASVSAPAKAPTKTSAPMKTPSARPAKTAAKKAPARKSPPSRG